jgi:hypothetical protein
MKRKTSLYFVISLVIVLIILGLFLFFKPSSQEENHSPAYQNVLSQIEEGNQYVIEKELSDGCFPYRYFNRGCYYDQSKNYLVSSDLQNQNLTHFEIIDLCYKFAHKGSIAYCLSMNNEKQKCSDFAGNNNYLNQICNLKEGNVIPSAKFGPYNYSNCYPEDCELLPSGSCTDENCMIPSDAVEPVKYSDLI